MSYYTGVGDYYSGKGDPGFRSILGGILSGVSKVASAVPVIGGTVSAVTGAASKIISGRGSGPISSVAPPQITRPATPTPGIAGFVQRALPGGSSGYQCGAGNPCSPGYHLDKTKHEKCVRNRRTNYANPRALARASKRLDGFVGVARKAMKSTNYKVVSKSYKQNWRKPLKR